MNLRIVHMMAQRGRGRQAWRWSCRGESHDCVGAGFRRPGEESTEPGLPAPEEHGVSPEAACNRPPAGRAGEASRPKESAIALSKMSW